MNQVELIASERETLGKQVKQLRRMGIVPAVLDRKGEESINIQVKATDLDKALRTKAGENALLNLSITGDKRKMSFTAIIKKITRNPLTHQFWHVDFHGVSLLDKIVSRVPIVIIGDPKAIKAQNGMAEGVLSEVEVLSLPDHIPGHLEVDITNINAGESILAGDIALPEGVELRTPADAAVVVGQWLRTAGGKAEGESSEAAEAPAAE